MFLKEEYFKNLLNKKAATKIFDDLDENKDGVISREEFNLKFFSK